MKGLNSIILLFILGLTSCIPYKEIDIQYIKESKIKIPSDFSNPLILINFYQNGIGSKRKQFEYAIDSIASEEAALSLKENLQESPWFEGLDIPIRKYFRFDSSKFIKPLTWSAIKSIANFDSTDLIVSLEYIKIMQSTDSYKTQNDESEYFYGYLKAPIYCYWRVYDVAKKQISNGYLYRDTLFWDASDLTPVSVGRQIPGYFDAAAYAGSDCGKVYAEKIAPSWVDDKRILFNIGSVEMEKASAFVKKGQWVEAASEWQNVFAIKKRKLSAKAAFNMALASEMLGKFDIALEWLRKAKKYYPLPEIDGYQVTINARIENNSTK